MLRKSLFLLFILAAFTSPAPCRAVEALAPPLKTIPLGEKLVYKITWLKIPVGTGELHVTNGTLNGREVIYAAGSICTNKILRKIFPVQDEAYSWIDPETFESLQFEKKIDELIINAHERLTFDRGKAVGRFESFKTGEKKEFKIRVPVHDVLSAFFWTRRQLSEPGRTARIVLTADQKDWELEIPGFRREKIKIDGKEIETLRVEPVTRVGGEEKKGRAWFNVTTDASRKPVRIVYKAPFGRMVGTLADA